MIAGCLVLFVILCGVIVLSAWLFGIPSSLVSVGFRVAGLICSVGCFWLFLVWVGGLCLRWWLVSGLCLCVVFVAWWC